MKSQAQLIQLLKKKGIGKTMSKSLDKNDCAEVLMLMQDSNCNVVTKGTLITALLCLETNEFEAELLSNLKKLTTLENNLHQLLTLQKTSSELFNAALQIITGTHLSYMHAKQAFELLLDKKENDTEKAIFLEALRLNEETFDENSACLDLFFERANHHSVDIPLLIDIATPYDGFNRNHLFLPFVAATLGALGFPTILHGVDSVAPKFGLTCHNLLRAAGKDPLKPASAIISDLKHADIAWGYCDQSISFPTLHNLKGLRKAMVKRPLLATMEKFLQPIYSTNSNYIVTGYTHPAYREKTTQLLQHLNKWDASLIFRGTEGSPQLSLDRRAPSLFIKNEAIEENFVSPEDFGLARYDKIEANRELTIQNCLEEGLSAMNGQPGFALDSIVYQVSAISKAFKLIKEESIHDAVLTCIANKKALSHFTK
jgi:anthranilate phosphoribosyltransferase